MTHFCSQSWIYACTEQHRVIFQSTSSTTQHPLFCFCSYTVKRKTRRVLFMIYLVPRFFHFFSFFKITSKNRTELLSRVLKSKKAVMCFYKKLQVESALFRHELQCCWPLMNQQYILNKVPLNTTTHKTSLYIDCSMKIL